MVGVSHKTAPIDIRENFFLNPTRQDLLLAELKSNPKVVEAFVLCTCNRTEIYAHLIDGPISSEFFIDILSKVKKTKLPLNSNKYFYKHCSEEAIRHLFKVVSGLDSLVLGEKQILGQVKDSVLRAKESGIFSKYFNILSNLALRTGKKAHTETDISYGGLSVSWAAIVKAEQLLGDLNTREVLMIGAGKMSKLAVGQISNKGFKRLYLMNRTPEHAKQLAERFMGEVVSFCDIKETLARVDLLLCSSSAPHYILDPETVKKVMAARKNRELILIDISMPRNIDPKVADIPNVQLFHIDDLDSVVNETLVRRESSVKAVEKIIDDKIQNYYSRLKRTDQIHSQKQLNAAGSIN